MVQTLPTLKTLRKEHQVDVVVAKSSFGIPRDFFDGGLLFLDDLTHESVVDYDGKIETIWGHIHGKDCQPLKSLPTVNQMDRQQMRLDVSEVRTYLNAAEDLGMKEDDFEYSVSEMLQTTPMSQRYDVVLANGYNYVNTADRWIAKSYPYYGSVSLRLQSAGYSVCSVGSNLEVIPNTVDETGWDLKQSAWLIQQAKLVISNDSAAYHIASALGKFNFVLFTFTSKEKNFDSDFHWKALKVTRELDCQSDCHQNLKWKSCPHMNCREMRFGDIAEHALTVLRQIEEASKNG
jgi:ADP-heptose:LPS heptosyltransferase